MATAGLGTFHAAKLSLVILIVSEKCGPLTTVNQPRLLIMSSGGLREVGRVIQTVKQGSR